MKNGGKDQIEASQQQNLTEVRFPDLQIYSQESCAVLRELGSLEVVLQQPGSLKVNCGGRGDQMKAREAELEAGR